MSNPRDWIMGVDGLVVDDDSGPVVPQLELLQTPETEKSFNFGALDPSGKGKKSLVDLVCLFIR